MLMCVLSLLSHDSSSNIGQAVAKQPSTHSCNSERAVPKEHRPAMGFKWPHRCRTNRSCSYCSCWYGGCCQGKPALKGGCACTTS